MGGRCDLLSILPETTTLGAETTRYRKPKKTTTIKTTTIRTTTPTPKPTTTLAPTTKLPSTTTTVTSTTQSSTIGITTILADSTYETTTYLITEKETTDINTTTAISTTTVPTTTTTTVSTTITTIPSTISTLSTQPTTISTTEATTRVTTPRPTFKPIIPGSFNDTSYNKTSNIHIGDLAQNGLQVDDCCAGLATNGPLGFGDGVDLNKKKKNGKACLQFSEVDQQKYACLRDPISCPEGLSMSIWLKISFDNNDVTRRYIISSGGDLQGTAGTAFYHEGVYLHALVSTGLDTWHLVVPNTAPNNAWTNIGLRWHTKQGLHMFINGQPVGYVRFPEARQSNNAVVIPETESKLTIGCRRKPDGTFEDFVSGDFDEFAMWTRYLPDKETSFFMGSYDKEKSCNPETDALRCETNTEDLLENVKNINWNDLNTYNQSMGLLANVSMNIAGRKLRGGTGVLGGSGYKSEEQLNEEAKEDRENRRLVNDLKNMAGIVNAVIRRTTDTIGSKKNISSQNLDTFYSMQDVISNIFDAKTKNKWKKIQKTESGSVKLVQIINRWTLQKVQQTTFPNKTVITTKISQNVASQAVKSTVGRLKREYDPYIYFPDYERNQKLKRIQTRWEGVSDYIRVPSRVFGDRDKATEAQLIMSLYNTLHTFAPLQNVITGVDTTLVFLDSRVIVFDVTPDYSFLVLKDDPVLYYVEHTQKRPVSPPKRRRLLAEDILIYTADIVERYCVWWDDNLYLEEQDFRGGWNTEGCAMENSTDEHSTCICNQLGTFTVLTKLMRPATIAPEEEWIKICRWVLYLISAMLLMFYMLSIAIKGTLHEQFHAIRLNCSLAALGGLLSVFASDFVKDDPYGCRVLSGFIQYFFLAVSFFLCVDSHALFCAIVSGVVGGRLPCYLPLGWGFPLIILGGVIGMYPDYGLDKRCFVGPSKAQRLSFVVPIMAFGIVALLLAILTLSNTKSPVIKRKLIVSELSSCTKALCFVTFIFVLTWMFGLLGLVEMGYPFDTMKHFHPIFSIMNSALGIYYVVPFVTCSKHFKNSVCGSGKADMNPNNKVDPEDPYEQQINDSQPLDAKDSKIECGLVMDDEECVSPSRKFHSMTWSLPSLSELIDKGN